MSRLDHNGSNWRKRYTRLYSLSHIKQSTPNSEKSMRMISFMTHDENPYTSLLVRNRRETRTKDTAANIETDSKVSTISEAEDGTSNEDEAFCELEAEPSLLQLLKSRRQSTLSTQLPGLSTTTSREEGAESARVLRSTEHYSSLRARDTERSASRSRFSTRRLDLHATTFLPIVPPYPAHAKAIINPFAPCSTNDDSDVPRWSVRRFSCEACSQKWKDRSSIHNVKNSGLKKNSSQANSISSVTAPARLQTSILSQYTPHPAIAVENEIGRNSLLSAHRCIGSASWQLKRARRSRPRPTPIRVVASSAHLPPSLHRHSTDPNAAATLLTMPTDLEQRVNTFLKETP